MAGTRVDRRVERGNESRRLVLGHAAKVASVEGLEGLSLGRLAGELGLSKSGVFALFGAKEELQLATVRAAAEVYVEHVVRPALRAPAGLGRVWRLCQSWLAYSEQRVFPGGCFFYAVAAEFDAREGAVRDAIARAQADWVRFVEQTITEALDLGEAKRDTDVPQLAFEVIALLEAANGLSLLHGDPACYRRAATAVLSRLRAVATDPSALPAAP
ncbi:TetR family transcriptional regulator [Nonomuraea sp. 3-1Str]|uniref:TetR/AcrR family transcriptional regulator n=1 Tax=Nonomuraea sp. 3-1Str TaxID=2929801 RepID=UPI0028644EED|nr:TetR/AcrR family transcriptional regulator [Nonomuraea sp. 3-1Str]MDR8411174.1 TetR family transcriptional regulator [Nonomuraea sp. 3-1Str]